MAVDVDLSQYCDVILLWNAVVMFLISFFTDYWEYRTYDYANLVPTLRGFNETLVRDYEQLHMTTSVVVEFFVDHSCAPIMDATEKKSLGVSEAAVSDAGSKAQPAASTYRIYLFSEYGNLFKECNDLEDALRLQLQRDRAMYASSCYYYMFAKTPWHRFHNEHSIQVAETLTLVLGSVSAVLSLVAMFNGTLGAIRNHPRQMTAAGVCLAAEGILYLCTVILFAVKLHFVQRYYANQSTVSCQEALVNSYRRQTLGWSYVAAILSLLLTAVSAYVFIMNSKGIRRRRARIKRRQRMEAALMSSCKQDVALALRAKMIVVSPDNDCSIRVC